MWKFQARKYSVTTELLIRQKENKEQRRNGKYGGNENRGCAVLLLFKIPKAGEVRCCSKDDSSGGECKLHHEGYKYFLLGLLVFRRKMVLDYSKVYKAELKALVR